MKNFLLLISAVCLISCVTTIDKLRVDRPWIPETTVLKYNRLVDKIDYPFIDDPEVLGEWISVDFVPKPEFFLPKVKYWTYGLFLREIVFYPNGRTHKMFWTWTKNMVIHSQDMTASQYIIQEVEGGKYLFLEWKSGDYIIRKMKPMYYVFKKVK